MKLDEKALLDAMARAQRSFDSLAPFQQSAYRAEARAFCVELARQALVPNRTLPAIYRDELLVAFLPPKREPDVEAAVKALASIRGECRNTGCDTLGTIADTAATALRALGVEEER